MGKQQMINILRKAIPFMVTLLMLITLALIVTKVYKPKTIIIERTVTESIKGEKGDKGDTGNSLQIEGHWETYCVYPKNEDGYRTQGAMIRRGSGDCKDSWKTVGIWEK